MIYKTSQRYSQKRYDYKLGHKLRDVLILTGCSNGLGSEIQGVFKKYDYEIHGLTKNIKNGTPPEILQCDLSKISDIKRTILEIFKNIKKDKGEIRKICLILNASIVTPFGLLENISSNEIMDSLSINYLANVLVLKCFLEQTTDLNSSLKIVLNISSGVTDINIKDLFSYTLSKHNQESLINILDSRDDLKKSHYHFHNIFPGAIDTKMQESLRGDFNKLNNPELFHLFNNLHINEKLKSPKDVASSIFQIANSISRGNDFLKRDIKL